MKRPQLSRDLIRMKTADEMNDEMNDRAAGNPGYPPIASISEEGRPSAKPRKFFVKHPNKTETIALISNLMANQANRVLGSDDCPYGAYLPEAEEIYYVLNQAGALYSSRSGATIPRAERRRRKCLADGIAAELAASGDYSRGAG